MKLFALAIGIFGVLSAASAFAGDEKGNGGGGLNKDGTYITLGSANFFVDPTPLSHVPGIDTVQKVLQSLPLSPAQRSAFLEILLPIGPRQYFNIPKLDKRTYEKLVDVYAEITKQPKGKIVIFAVSDIDRRITYLLPAFYKLKKNEQAAIIFHEAAWIYPKWARSYDNVVKLEVAFQKYLDKSDKGEYEPSLGHKLGQLFQDFRITFNMDLAEDLKSGALAGLGADMSGLPVQALLAPEYGCSASEIGPNSSQIILETKSHRQSLLIYELSLKHPKSFFLPNLLNFMAQNTTGYAGSINVKLDLPAGAAQCPWTPVSTAKFKTFDSVYAYTYPSNYSDDWGRERFGSRTIYINISR